MYELVVAKNGPKFAKSEGEFQGLIFHDGVPGTGMWLPVKHATMAQFANSMGYSLDRPVLDRTGLKGTFDFDLR